MIYLIYREYIGAGAKLDRWADSATIALQTAAIHDGDGDPLDVGESRCVSTVHPVECRETVLGVFPSEADALAEVVRQFGAYRETCPGGVPFSADAYADDLGLDLDPATVLKVVKPYAYAALGDEETENWLRSGPSGQIPGLTPGSTDADLNRLAEEFEADAREQGLSLGGAELVRELLEEARADLREEQAS